MEETVTTLEVRKRLGEILDRVALRHDQFIIERKGKPLAAVVPVEKLAQVEKAARSKILEILDRPGRRIAQAEADRVADEAKHASRRRGRRRARRRAG